MNSEDVKNILEILDIIVIPIVVATIAISWANIQSWYRKRRFTKLILRELEEFTPYPETEKELQYIPDPAKKNDTKNWNKHLTKKFIHKKIFDEESVNRDFILSLDPDLVYFVKNLWEAYTNADQKQFVHFLREIFKNYIVRYSGVQVEDSSIRTSERKTLILKWEKLITKDYNLELK